MKKSSVNWKNNFSQLGDFFNSTKLIVFLNIYSSLIPQHYNLTLFISS